MNKFSYYTEALKKYARFDGRANLSQFWYFVLFNFIISVILGLIHKNVGNLYNLLVLTPSLAVGARRLHDIGKSGWMQLVGLIPIVGWIWLIVLFARKGDAEDNEYGTVVSGLNEDSKDGKLGQKVDSFKEKVEDFGEKVSNKVEGFSKKVEEKTKDIIEDIKG